MKNQTLSNARKAKNDEFYTYLHDIEKELQYYKNHFYKKTVYCNCDDPRTSNFYTYFKTNFHQLKLRKLIATHYQNQQMQLIDKQPERPLHAEYDGLDTTIRELKGNGDFRSDESTNLLKKSDIVVTNPPFSLFRTFINFIVSHDKKFLILGNINALTNSNVFPLFEAKKIWFGINKDRLSFYTLNGEVKGFGNIRWYTNLEHNYIPPPIPLTKKYSPEKYPKYANCTAINVDRIKDIPHDYPGEMGVPITFIDKYNPEQFEIIRYRKNKYGQDLILHDRFPYDRIVIRNRNPTKK